MNDAKYWVWLSMIFGTASRRIWEAMRLFEYPEEAYEEISSGGLNERLNENEMRSVKNIDIDMAVSHIEECHRNGIGIVGYGSSEYPPQLRHILNPPAVLYYKGNILCLTGTRTVTSVGTRHPCEYSLYACGKICRELAKSGITIVSGFAVGIDIASHLAAVSVNRPTACVLGCGVDVEYPRDNVQFREEILANGGVFLSEFPPGTPPNSPNFPKRNRILSALGRATLVFEAAGRSGSLITAGMALEQGREVFCLPPADIFSKYFAGNIAFLRDGATPLYSSLDVLNCFKFGGANDCEIRFDTYSGISSFGVGELEPGRKRSSVKKGKKSSEKIRKKADEIIVDAPENTEASAKAFSGGEIYDSLSDIQKKITDLISGSIVHADMIASQLGIDPVEMTAELTELEILGIIKALPGKMFEIA